MSKYEQIKCIERTVLLKDLKFQRDADHKNNFIEPSNYIELYRTLKPVARISKFFAALVITFKVPTKLFSNLYPAKF